MAKSIREVGEKIEKTVEKEIAKKEGEILKDVVKTLPSDTRVRVMKLDEGTRVYVTTVSIDEYDKTDPYAWIKRRFAKKHGSGEYVLEFISPEGEVIKSSPPIYIEADSNQDKSAQEFLKKAEEALRLKEEAIDKKVELSQKLSQLETEKANILVELVNKQLDMMTRLYEERINAVKEKLEKGAGADSQILLLELQRIKDDYRAAVDKIYDVVRQAAEEKQPEYLSVVMDIMKSSLEKNSFSEAIQVLSMLKDIFKPDQEKKDFLEDIIENPQKAEMFKKLMGIDDKPDKEKKDFFEEILENPQKLEVFKKLMGIDEKKDLITELAENPQKLEMIKKLFGLDEVREIKSSLTDVIHRVLAREERPKDMIEEIVEYGEKLRRMKDILAPLLGAQVQPVKSFLELVSTIVNSPTMPEIVSRIMEGHVKAKLIEQGFIPTEYAGAIVDVRTVKQSGGSVQLPPGTQGQGQVQTQGQVQEQTKQKTRKRSRKEDIQMLKNAIAQAIQIAAQETQGDEETPETFARRIAEVLFRIGKENPVLAAIAISMPRNKREEVAKQVLKEMIPDIPDDMLDTIVSETENIIREKVSNEL